MTAAGSALDRVRRLPAPDRPDRGDRRAAPDRVQAAHARPGRVLALHDEELLALAAAADVRRRYARFDPRPPRARRGRGRAGGVCRCRDEYPQRLRELADPPAVLHVLGDPAALGDEDGRGGRRRAAGVVRTGSRSPARSAAGCRRRSVPVVSGLALGVDSAAHAGALRRRDDDRRARRRRARRLSRARLAAARGGRGARRGDLRAAAGRPAPPLVLRRPQPHHRRARRGHGRRQATERSGSLTTADFAAELGRTVGAVPGPVTQPAVRRHHALIQAGAPLIRDAADALDLLAGPTGKPAALTARRSRPRRSTRRRSCAPAGRGGGRPRRARRARRDAEQAPRRAGRPVGELELLGRSGAPPAAAGSGRRAP